MSDIFSNEVGGGYDPFQSAEPTADAGVDNGSTDAADTTASTDGTAIAADQGASDQGSQQQEPIVQPEEGQQQATGQLSEADLAKLEQEADNALQNEQTPKWYKNVVGSVYKPKLESLGKQVEAYSAFGTPEELTGRLALLDGLNEVRRDPATGMPVRTTEGFVKNLHETDPETAYRLMNDLATMPAPNGEGNMISALFNQIGIDVNRLTDIQAFAQNGYQLQAGQFTAPDAADLAEIPEHLRSTFGKLDPTVRESLMSDIESVRNSNLEAHKVRIETQEREQAEAANKTQREEAELAQRQAEFKAQVDTKGQENFSKASTGVLSSFVESLANQAGMSKLDSLMVANTVLNAFEPTTAGEMSLAALKEAGIEIDASVQQTIADLEQTANYAAYYELTGDKASLTREVAKLTDLQAKLTAKGNKIVAALAVKRSNSVLTPQRQASNQIANTVNNNRFAAAGVPTNGLPSNQNGMQDFSDAGWEEAISNDPFFQRR